jgi:hypothetical protein
MKRANFWTLAGITILAVVWVACGSASFLKKSPENVVKAFLKAANDGKYSEAEGYLASSTKVLMAAAGGIKEFADKETRDGQIQSVEIVKVETRGEGAKVYYKIRYKDGQAKDDDATLIKENGEWKISG